MSGGQVSPRAKASEMEYAIRHHIGFGAWLVGAVDLVGRLSLRSLT